MDLVRGTVFLLNYVHWTRFDTFRQTKDFFVLSVTADLAHLWHCEILRFTKFFNNNNNRSVLVAIYLQS